MDHTVCQILKFIITMREIYCSRTIVEICHVKKSNLIDILLCFMLS